MARHVVLVGLMGSGKTTVGRRVAKLLDRDFVDADTALEEIADRSIAEIFECDGESGFRDLEQDVFEELLKQHEPTVIAAGGGLVLRAANRARLCGRQVTVVFLDAAPAFLASRVKRRPHRPLLNGSRSRREVVDQMHRERAPLYADVADITVSVEPFHRDEDRPKDALAARIAGLVAEHEQRVAP